MRWRICFDAEDQELLEMVQNVLGRERSGNPSSEPLNPYLNPHGIVELAAPQSYRIAYAMIHLLHSLEIGRADDRLRALQSLHQEVMNISHGHLRRNTARVLLQIMKELVRKGGEPRRQLELAHDFRMAASGKPRDVRRELRRYHLLEMPEEWNQIAFDDHVHDANTKGRKTPTHLIMDAWIKGIRRLTVVYYNFVPPEAAGELLEAGRIMGITIRIGVSLGAQFRGKNVRFIWVPRGFADSRDFLAFLEEPHVRAFMEEGRQVSRYQQGPRPGPARGVQRPAPRRNQRRLWRRAARTGPGGIHRVCRRWTGVDSPFGRIHPLPPSAALGGPGSKAFAPGMARRRPRSAPGWKSSPGRSASSTPRRSSRAT